MPSPEEIADQQKLLATYRQTLVYCLDQQAKLTTTYAPPAVFHGIQEARDNIRRIKSSLRGWGVEVEDHPDDEPPAAAPPEDQSLPSSSPPARDQAPVERGDEPRDRTMVPESPGAADAIADAPDAPSPATIEERNHTDEAALKTKQLGCLPTIQSIKKLFKQAYEVLGAPAWQGIGVVVGILGLILTVVLSSQPPTSLPTVTPTALVSAASIAAPPVAATLTAPSSAMIGVAASAAPAVPTPMATAPAESTRVRSAAPAPAESTRVGIASFDGCPQQSDALQRAVASEFSQAVFKRLDVIRDAGSARAQPDLDLVIWGQCDQGAGQLTLSLQILVPPGPPEVGEIDRMTVQTSARDLDYATRLSQALMSYVGGDYGAAAASLGTLRQQTQLPSEQASLAFLQGNSLLFTERYTDTLAAYEGALAVDSLRFQALNNRGIAGINLALQLGRAHKPYETILKAARGDLSSAAEAPDKQVAALAVINRGAANYWVGEDYQRALADCDAALDRSGDDPLGYVCRAAARYGALYDAFCKPQPDTKLARDDLSRAKELAESQGRPAVLADIYFFRAQLAQLQADCDTADVDKRTHQQEATSYFQQFLAEDGKRRVHLAIDRVMVELTPREITPTEQP